MPTGSLVLRDFFSAPCRAHRDISRSPMGSCRPRCIPASPLPHQVLHCSGHMRVYKPQVQISSAGSPGGEPPLQCLVLICEAIPHPGSLEPPLGRGAFLSRHSLDMKFTYCDERWPTSLACPAPLSFCPNSLADLSLGLLPFDSLSLSLGFSLPVLLWLSLNGSLQSGTAVSPRHWKHSINGRYSFSLYPSLSLSFSLPSALYSFPPALLFSASSLFSLPWSCT